MSKLQNNFTTPEQSKRLLELGVPADSADCYYDWYGTEIELHPYKVVQVFNGDDTFTILKDRFKRELLPCWSVGRLIEIICKCRIHYIDDSNLMFNFKEGALDNLAETFVKTFECDYNDGCIDFSKLDE